MNNIQKIYNLIILDESGSMQLIKKQTLLGFEDLAKRSIETQKLYPNQKHYFSIVTFNERGIKFRLSNQSAEEMNLINSNTYQPYGETPLYEAICKSVLKLDQRLVYEKDFNVLVTIITDGVDNCSKEFNKFETRKLIETFSIKQNWAFGLIGANIDIGYTARDLSIPKERTLLFETTDESVKQMFERYFKVQDNLAYLADEHSCWLDLAF